MRDRPGWIWPRQIVSKWRKQLYRVISDEFVWDEDGEGAGVDEALSFGAAIAPVLRPREAAQSSSVVKGGLFIGVTRLPAWLLTLPAVAVPARSSFEQSIAG
jgi:hypothetical protein